MRGGLQIYRRSAHLVRYKAAHSSDSVQIVKLLLFVSWRALGFWNFVSLMTDSLLIAAFSLRVTGIAAQGDRETLLRTRSFQCLSFVAPLIWMSTFFMSAIYVLCAEQECRAHTRL